MPIHAVLVSTYERGHQPFGLASPAAWLRRAGAEVGCLDLSRQRLDVALVRRADLVAFCLPMHTATRMAVRLIGEVRRENPRAHLAAYGLYAALNAERLRELGVGTLIGGEFEEELADLVARLAEGAVPARPEPIVSLRRQTFVVPDRAGLPALESYARLARPDGREQVVGYTEASRGCKHRCRHCPIVPVYDGRFRAVPREVVLADVRQQVEAGAEHISFGDPDFFNGVSHAVRLVHALHAEFPTISYDVTIKVQHLLAHADVLPILRDTGCAFVTSAVESLDDELLERLDKGHTRADFLRVVTLFRQHDLVLAPTLMPFTPWTTLSDYRELLHAIAELGLVPNVAPVQYAIRMLIPRGSLLLELGEVRALVGEFDSERLAYPWRHPDERMDDLQAAVELDIQRLSRAGADRHDVHGHIVTLVDELAGCAPPALPVPRQRVTIPFLTEPWYC